MSKPLFFPIYGFESYCDKITLAVFFDWSDAMDFLQSEPRNLYLDMPLFQSELSDWARQNEAAWQRHAKDYQELQAPSDYAIQVPEQA